MTKMRIYCDIHGERQIRGKSLDVLRRVFFGSPEKDEAETPHERLVHQLEYAALSKNLKRSPAEMMVYAPITGCPSAYERYMSFESFIQTTLKGDRDFRSNPNRFRDLETYMVKYNEVRQQSCRSALSADTRFLRWSETRTFCRSRTGYCSCRQTPSFL